MRLLLPRKGRDMINRQEEYAERLLEQLDADDELSKLDLLDDLAVTGLKLTPSVLTNEASVAYMKAVAPAEAERIEREMTIDPMLIVADATALLEGTSLKGVSPPVFNPDESVLTAAPDQVAQVREALDLLLALLVTAYEEILDDEERDVDDVVTQADTEILHLALQLRAQMPS